MDKRRKNKLKNFLVTMGVAIVTLPIFSSQALAVIDPSNNSDTQNNEGTFSNIVVSKTENLNIDKNETYDYLTTFVQCVEDKNCKEIIVSTTVPDNYTNIEPKLDKNANCNIEPKIIIPEIKDLTYIANFENNQITITTIPSKIFELGLSTEKFKFTSIEKIFEFINDKMGSTDETISGEINSIPIIVAEWVFNVTPVGCSLDNTSSTIKTENTDNSETINMENAEIKKVTPRIPELIPMDKCSIEQTINISNSNKLSIPGFNKISEQSEKKTGIIYEKNVNGNVITVTARPDDGYVFMNGAKEAKWVFDITADTNIPCMYNVSFDLNGGKNKDKFSDISVIQGSSINIYKEIPVREGYEFLGWLPEPLVKESGLIQDKEDSKLVDDNDKCYVGLLNSGAVYIPTKDIMLVAQWKAELRTQSIDLTTSNKQPIHTKTRSEKKKVFPIEPELIPSEKCGEQAVLNIPSFDKTPSVAGVNYTISREKGSSIVTIIATPKEGYVFGNGEEFVKWDFNLEAKDCSANGESKESTKNDTTSITNNNTTIDNSGNSNVGNSTNVQTTGVESSLPLILSWTLIGIGLLIVPTTLKRFKK